MQAVRLSCRAIVALVPQYACLSKPLQTRSICYKGYYYILTHHRDYQTSVFESIQQHNVITNNSSRRPMSSGHGGKVINFMLADIGEGINEVMIREWFVKVGDTVKQFDSICEVQSDKASVTITSRYDGVISKIYHDIESVAKVGQPLVDIILDDGTSSCQTTSPQSSETSATAHRTLKSESAPKTIWPRSSVEVNQHKETSNVSLASIPTLPAVRRLAKERNVDLRLVKATGKDGRVTKEDLINFLESKENQSGIIHKQQPSTATTTKLQQRIRLKGIRQAMFKTMEEALKIPHFSLSEEIDVTRLSEFIRRLRNNSMNSYLPENCPKINHLAFMVKVCSMALIQYPQLNSIVETDSSGNHLVQKPHHNIGIAIDTSDGLVVPNIKNVETLSVIEIAQELARLKDASAQLKLSPRDVTDGTFSISNIGSIGGIRGYPVIMPPQVAIGAVGRIRRLPRFDSDSEDNSCVVARDIIEVVWAADHRVIDGATMTRFSNLWKAYLEDSALITLALK
ncbi:Lipoamide acyltransferase component of branched-chain alpha-keto acid dehydrogenase complex, mitochondrial, partial [Fragariocoptes setiger]